MKKFISTTVLLAFFTTCTTIMAQVQQEEYLGLPGDNLNLYAVMKLFQESETLESFERSLNDANSKINNLDLNGDNYVDYIRVLDYVEGDVHNIVLQVPVNNSENQDVAVFTVQRFSNGQVQIQLTGDEALYGKNYIIEPIFEDNNSVETPNPGYLGNTEIIYGRNVRVIRTTTYEIASWPLIRFIYLPTYVIWRSSWYWGYYPSYWNPWRPYYWHYYYGYHYNWYNHYYGHYRRLSYHRFSHWNNFYYSSIRCYSPHVNILIRTGNYRTTYSRPDQRRAGEAMYTKMLAEQSTRRTNNTSINNTVRRSATQTASERQYTNNSTSRRTTPSAASRSVNSTNTIQNTAAERRTATTINNRSAAKAPLVQNTTAARRSAATTKSRPVATPQAKQNTSTATRSSSAVTNRPSTKVQAVQNNGSARRSTATVNSNPVARTQAAQKSATAPRSVSTVSSRPVVKTPTAKNAGTISRSSSTSAMRSVTKAPARQSIAAQRSPSRPASAGISSASRRSSGSSKPAPIAKSGGNSKSSGISKATSRR